jgi:hypothetical protein
MQPLGCNLRTYGQEEHPDYAFQALLGVDTIGNCVGKAYREPGARLKVSFLPVKSTGVQFVLVLPQDEKS